MNKSWYAVATLVGTVIGAGILGIPYAIQQTGVVNGIIMIIIVGLLLLLLNLYLGEVILRTKGKHQLSGYAEKYLGKWGRRIMSLFFLFTVTGALVAYIIGEGYALSSLFGGSAFLYSTIFWLIASALVYLGLRSMSRSELILSSLKLMVLIFLVILLVPLIDTKNLVTFTPRVWNFLFPLGVVVFSLLGFTAIPEMTEVLQRQKKQLKKAIIMGYAITILANIIFVLIILGVAGSSTQEVATTGLGVFGPNIFLFGNLFAILTLATPYFTLALALQEMYNYDYKINKKTSFLLACGLPYVIFLVGARSFIDTIGIVGIVSGAIMAILVVLMAWRAEKNSERTPEYTIKKSKILEAIMIMLFVVGALFALFTALD